MDYNTVTDDITRLTDDLNTWSSTLCIPVNDSDDLLDISSAANGANSSVPPGAKNQPISFPTSKGLRSVYRFDPAVFFGQSSWDSLRSMLRSAVSGCNNISVQKTLPPNSMRAKYYILGCDHSRLYQPNGSISYLDEKVGPLHVVDEKAKRHKSFGSKSKGTLGMVAKTKKAIRQKCRESAVPRTPKKNDVRRCITGRAILKDDVCTMKLHVYMLHNNEWYLHSQSCLKHCNHPMLPSNAKAKSSMDMSPGTKTLVSTTI